MTPTSSPGLAGRVASSPPFARVSARTGMDALILEDLVFLKEEQPALANDVDWRSLHELD